MVSASKISFGCFLMLSFASGCTTPSPKLGMASAQPSKAAQDVVNGTKQLCQFVPTVTSILAILNAPGAPAADKVVQAVCAQVNKTAQASFIEPGKKFTVTVLGRPVDGALAK